MKIFGMATPRSAARVRILPSGIEKHSLGLEIGPSHCRVAANRDGFHVRVLDHLDAAGLIHGLRNLHLIGLEGRSFHATRGHEFFATLHNPAVAERSVA